MIRRIKAYLARRKHLRRLADDVAVRRALVGNDYAKRREAARKGLSA